MQDRNGNLSLGAIANLVDEVGGAAMHADGHHMKVSVDMSICFLANAKLHVSNMSPPFLNFYSFLYLLFFISMQLLHYDLELEFKLRVKRKEFEVKVDCFFRL